MSEAGDKKPDPLVGDPSYYRQITALITLSFIFNGLLLLGLNTVVISGWLLTLFGPLKAFVIQLFFWAALGATVAASIFMNQDKEVNELERLKGTPDLAVLRFPNAIDVWLYGQRILTSGFLGVIGASLFVAGLWYFDVPISDLTPKHQLFLAIVSFTVGLYQTDFLSALKGFWKKLLTKNTKP